MYRLRISRQPAAYEQLLRLGRERSDAIFLEIGCCFGVDVRKAVSDGFPTKNIVASDLIPEFWELGHKLFKSSPQSFPVHFVGGDAFNPAHLEIVPPFLSLPTTPRPDLSTLNTLTPLLGHVSAIHASLFFHLFNEPNQLYLARALAGLLSPVPGSIIFGTHAGRTAKGFRVEDSRSNGTHMFCHSPESWTEMWQCDVFSKGEVRVDTTLRDVTDRVDQKPVEGQRLYLLEWSVLRL